MFAVMTGLIAAYVNYNLSIEAQMKIQEERAREQIAITQIGVDTEGKIENITVSNIGGIEVRIRALYREKNGIATLLIDPPLVTYPKEAPKP